MNPIAQLVLLTAALAASGLPATAREAEPVPSSRLDYSSFRIIAERNIFNANRSGRSGRASWREAERRVRTDTFTLLGTMSYEKGRFAFFDGSGSEFRKVLQPEESIVGFKLAEITSKCVTLQTTNGQTLELCVGMRMKRREGEDWQLAGWAESSDGASPASNTTESSTSSGGDTDVLKRLIEQRARENGGTTETNPAAVPEPARIEPPKETGGETDEITRRLLQQREQELNK